MTPFLSLCFLHPICLPASSLTPLSPGAINTQIIDTPKEGHFDTRFLDSAMPKSEADKIRAMPGPQQEAVMKARARDVFSRFGYTSEEAADMIVDGTIARRTRILVGWDAVIVDWWVRAFPRIFLAPVMGKVAILSGVIGRHLVLPAGVLSAVGAGLWWLLRSRGSGGGGMAKL